MGRSRLTPRQQRFVDEYLVDLNATAAAVRAGYSARNADKIGSRLVGKSRVAEAIRQRQKKRAARVEIKADSVVGELGCVGFSDIGDIFDLSGPTPRFKPAHEIPERARRAIAALKVRRYIEGHGKDAQKVELVDIRFWPKTPALELLGKHVGLFQNGPVDGQVDFAQTELGRYLAAHADEPDGDRFDA